MESATAGKIPEKAHLLRKGEALCGSGGAVEGYTAQMRTKGRGSKVRLDQGAPGHGSAAASQFPKPDGSEVVGSTAAGGRGPQLRKWLRKGKLCLHADA